MRAIYDLYYPDLTAKDPTYNISFVYSTIECNLAIITATIPSLRGRMKKWFPRLFSSTMATPGAYSGGSRGFATIGGSGGIAMKDLKSPARARHSRLDSLTNSEEEILGQSRITKTTSVHISYDENGHMKETKSPRSLYGSSSYNKSSAYTSQ